MNGFDMQWLAWVRSGAQMPSNEAMSTSGHRWCGPGIGTEQWMWLPQQPSNICTQDPTDATGFRARGIIPADQRLFEFLEQVGKRGALQWALQRNDLGAQKV
jgi:hypothetical protein